MAQQQVQIQSLQTENLTLRAELANLLEIDDYVALAWVHDRPTVQFRAVNLQEVNVAGSETANGLGNILIGYEGERTAGGTWQLDHKGGSHYLVVGSNHNYSGYSGIVAGMGNTSNSPYASLTGGLYNIAQGWGTSVSGGARTAPWATSQAWPEAPTTSRAASVRAWPEARTTWPAAPRPASPVAVSTMPSG